MDSERWQRIQDVMDGALGLPPTDWAVFCKRACAGDSDLLREVLLYLDLTDTTDFLDYPVSGPPQPPSVIEPGPLRIGRYETLRLLGRGGMGEVYLAQRVDDYHQRVALKRIRSHLPSRDTIDRFHRERQILARLEHPHIARLLDGGTTPDGQPYLVMELVEGEPIDIFCRSQRLGLDARITLFRKVCAAIQFAHRHLVVHRDLKPENILVDRAGEPKLLDFGIAKLLAEEAKGSTETRGLGRMTLNFASPEQVNGQTISTASDLYSLGVLLYRLLTDRHPYRFPSESLTRIVQIITEQDPPAPSRAGDSASTGELLATEAPMPARRLRGDLDHIVLQTLRKEPEERYASVEQLSDDLERYSRGLPVLARQGGWLYTTGKFCRKYKMAVAVLLLSLGFGVTSSVLWQRAERARLAAEHDRRGAEQTMEFVRKLFRTNDPDVARGRNPTAREMLDRGRAQLPAFDHDLGRKATLADELGRLYLRIAEHELAQELMTEALRAQRRHTPEDSGALATRTSNLATVRYAAGHTLAAERGFRTTLLLRRQAEDPPLRTVRTLNNLASVLSRRGDYDEAERLFLEALELRRDAAADPLLIASSLHHLASLHYLAGRPAEAEPLAREVLATRRAHLGPDHTSVARAHHLLGTVLLTQTRLREAERELLPALEIQERLLAEWDLDLAATRLKLASLRLAEGEPAVASELASKALGAYRRTRSDDSWEIAQAESVLGSIHAALGRPDEARRLLERSHQVLVRAHGEHSIYASEAHRRLVELGRNPELSRGLEVAAAVP